MKRYFIYGLLMLACLISFSSCNSQDIDIDTANSIFQDPSDEQNNAFDQWALENYTNPYNISLKYRMEDKESDMEHVLTPALYDKSVVLAKIIKYVWLEAYDEVTGSPDFLRHYVPKTLHFIGSPAWQDNGTTVVGTAEGGRKITLYNVNDINIKEIDINQLNEYYFHTMHHEFAHILHQTKNYDPAFDRITENAYVGSDWYIKVDPITGVASSRYDEDAWIEGFVTAYAMSEPREDFVENISLYATSSKAEWNNMLQQAGETGRAIIEKKFDMVYNYMLQTWNIDLNDLRDVVLRRQHEIAAGEVDLSIIK